MPTKNKTKNKGFLTKLVNGFIIGNADNDPAGISAYTLTGANTGLSLSFFHLLSTPLLINTQAICARIGDVTKKGLASVIRLYYGPRIALAMMFLVVTANLATLGADFAGMATAIQLFWPDLNLLFILPLVAGLLWALVVFQGYRVIARVLAGLGIVFVAYIVTAFMTQPDWLTVLKGIFFPHLQFTRQFLLVAVALMGTTITPFLFYWQVTEEVEDHPTVRDVPTEIGQNAWGMIWTNLISTFIIITSALTLHRSGIQVNSAAEAALALEPLAGSLTSILFAVGFIGSGLLAVPVLALTTAYTIAETFHWRGGVKQKNKQAQSVYNVLTLSFFIGLGIALLKVNPISMLFYSQMLNGLVTPFVLIMIVAIASKEVIMKKYVIGLGQKLVAYLTVLVMLTSAAAAFLAGWL